MTRFVFLPYFWLSAIVFLSAIGNVEAQIIFQLAPETPIRPWILLSSDEEYIPEAPVISSLGPSLETPALATKDQILSLDLGIIRFAKRRTALVYRKSEALAQVLSDDSEEKLQIGKEDLPVSLFQEGGTVTLGISVGEDSLHFQGSASMTTDKIDISNEDYNSSNAIFYRLNPKEKTSWTFGLFQRTFLGDISPVYPLAEVAFDGSDYNVAMGAIHFPEYPNLVVVPFFRLTIKTQLDLALDIVFPVRASVYTTFFEDWSVEVSLEQRNEYYRLSRQAPWNSTTLHKTHLRSKVEIGYHLFSIFLLKLGAGNLSNRKYEFLDKDLDNITDFSLENKPLVTGHVSLAARYQFD